MTAVRPILDIRSSPHIEAPVDTETIMRNVVWALLPATAFAVYIFGWTGFLLLGVSTASCVLTEWILCRLTDRPNTTGDWSALITGLLLGLTLPPTLPLWMAALGGVVSIGLVKFLFGGLGANLFNPALAGRAFLMAAFPVAMTTWSAQRADGRFTQLLRPLFTPPFLQPDYDGISSPTPLGHMKFDQVDTPLLNLVLGDSGGSLGETCSLLILLGGAYLIYRRMMNWRIPCAIFLSVFAFGGILHWWRPEQFPSPFFHLFAGGLMLGAVFMATDMVTCPVTNKGVWVYGILIGIVVVVIRIWGGLPEGVMYAILLGNACSPLIERLTEPRPFGFGKPGGPS